MATPKPQRGGLERNSSLNWRALPGTMTKAWKAARPSPPQPASSPPPTPDVSSLPQHPNKWAAPKNTGKLQHHKSRFTLTAPPKAQHPQILRPSPEQDPRLGQGPIPLSAYRGRFEHVHSGWKRLHGGRSPRAGPSGPRFRARPHLPPVRAGPRCALAPSSPTRTGEGTAGEGGELRGRGPGVALPHPRSQLPLVLAEEPETNSHQQPPDVGSRKSSKVNIRFAWGVFSDAPALPLPHWAGPPQPVLLLSWQFGNVCFLGFLKFNTNVACSLFVVLLLRVPLQVHHALSSKACGIIFQGARRPRRPAVPSPAPGCPLAWPWPSGGGAFAPLLVHSELPVQGAV